MVPEEIARSALDEPFDRAQDEKGSALIVDDDAGMKELLRSYLS